MMQSISSGVLTGAVVVAACLATPALAQTGQAAADDRMAVRYVDPVSGMSIDQAVALALEREPELLAARTTITAARGGRQQAALRPNPMVSVMRQEQNRGSDNTTSTEVEWPLELFRRRSRIAAADRAIEVTEFAAADQERMLATTIRAG